MADTQQYGFFALFGSRIKDLIKRDTKVKPPKEEEVKSFVPKQDEDENAYVISTGAGAYGVYYDIDGTATNSERDMIRKYRMASENPDCDAAINDIINESIVCDSDMQPVNLNLDDLQFEDSIKEKIRKEFDQVLQILNFHEYGTEIFRRWYVDGRLYYHIIPYDSNSQVKGIEELRFVDPMYMKKVKEVKTKTDKLTGAKVDEVVNEYYVYDNTTAIQFSNNLKSPTTTTVRIDLDAIISVTSGIMDATRTRIISHLHKAIKPVNQLQMMEDALVIYRLSRAPERRIFYIDTGNLPSGKAEEYVRNMMSQYRNKIVYDATTGEVRDDRRHMSMIEDFWLPRREGGRGTEISTLPGGQNLSEIDDILYFQRKLYKSLNVPMTRLEENQGFTIGRATEINRDEVKFQKFIARLRKRFSYLFIDALRMQLLLKGIITEEDWEDIKNNIVIDYLKDNNFAELREFDLLKERIDLMAQLDQYVGKYYSKEYVRKNVLKQTDDDIAIIDKQINSEKDEMPDESDLNVDQFGQ